MHRIVETHSCASLQSYAVRLYNRTAVRLYNCHNTMVCLLELGLRMKCSEESLNPDCYSTGKYSCINIKV
jgi:hypothetical protein